MMERTEEDSEESRERTKARTYLEVSNELRKAYADYIDGISSCQFNCWRIMVMAEVLSWSLPNTSVYELDEWIRLDNEYRPLPEPRDKIEADHYMARGEVIRKTMESFGMVGQVEQDPQPPPIIDAFTMFWES